MAIIVEDGTGLAGAESFISLAGASSYHTARGNAAWAALASDAVREQALRKATDYMEQVYRLRWAGSRVTTVQALSWPRIHVPINDFSDGRYPAYYAQDEVPMMVSNACAELALRAASETLLIDETRAVLVEKVGPLEVSYDPHSASAKKYSAIDAMLRPLLTGSAGMPRMVRG
jgi:hypothetical protein